MISIKQNVAELDRLEQLWQQTLDCYVDSLDGVAKYGILACPPLVAKFKPRFAALHKTAISTKNSSDERQQKLASLRSDLNREIKQYSDEASSHYEAEAAAMKDIVALLAGTSESIKERGTRCTDKVADVSNSLEEVSKLEDLSSIRRILSEQVRNLRQWTEQFRIENTASVLALQKEVAAVREKLEQSEMAASTDVLTGLSNRYVAEKQMAMRIAKGTGFCLLLFDLDEFKSINDRLGHATGDEALRIFGRILREQVRPSDVVARWGGDEFLVVLSCELREAMARSQEISAKLSGRYPIEVAGREVKVTIKASAGVAEYRKGETSEDIFLRVDRSLYASKPKGSRTKESHTH